MFLKQKSLSRVRLFATPWTIQFMEFTRARILEWVAVPFPGNLPPNPGSKPGLLHCRHILYQLSHKLRKCTKWGKTEPKKNYKDVGKNSERKHSYDFTGKKIR